MRVRSSSKLSNDSEDIVLAHNQVVLTVNLDLGAAVFGEEDFVADFDVEFDLLAIVVELASTDGCDSAFLRLLFRRVGNDDVSLLDFFLFERLNQHAIAERFHIDCHMCSVSSWVRTRTLYPIALLNALVEETGCSGQLVRPSLIIRSMPLATSWASPSVV